MTAFAVEGRRLDQGAKAIHVFRANIAPLTTVVVLDRSASVASRTADQQFKAALCSVLRRALQDWKVIVMRLGDPNPIFCGPIKSFDVSNLLELDASRERDAPGRHRASLLRPVVERTSLIVGTGRALVLVYSDGALHDIEPIRRPSKWSFLGMAVSHEGDAWKTRWQHVLGDAPFVHTSRAFEDAMRRLDLAWDGQADLHLENSNEIEVLANGAWRKKDLPWAHDFHTGALCARTRSCALLSLKARDGTKIEITPNPTLSFPDIEPSCTKKERSGVHPSDKIGRLLPNLVDPDDAQLEAIVPEDMRRTEHLLVTVRHEAQGSSHQYLAALDQDHIVILIGDENSPRLEATWENVEWSVTLGRQCIATFKKGRFGSMRSDRIQLTYWPGISE